MHNFAAPKPGRDPKCILILGTNGTGKSTLACNMMNDAGKGLMVLPQFDDWAEMLPPTNIYSKKQLEYTGIKHHIYKNDDDFAAIFKNYHNGILTLDDCRVYVKSDLRHSHLFPILQRRRQMMCDIILMAHGFKTTPPQFFTFITDYVIFKVNDSPEIRKMDLGTNYDIVSKTVEQVRKMAEKQFNVFKWIKV